MWICLECREVFEEPQRWEERHGFTYGPFERLSGCPCCGEAYVEAYRCDCCDEWITGNYIKTDNDLRICENCYSVKEIGDEDY